MNEKEECLEIIRISYNKDRSKMKIFLSKNGAIPFEHLINIQKFMDIFDFHYISGNAKDGWNLSRCSEENSAQK